VLLSATQVRADMLCVRGAGTEKSFAPSDEFRPERFAQLDGKVLVTRLQREWEGIRADLARSVLEASLSMFFIKTNPPPSGNPPTPKTDPPPTDGANEPPPPPPPPPPDGQGEVPPIDPPVDEPPSATPEPGSLLLAAMGAGFISFCGWRRRKAKVK
jgi:hypothetical protein